MGSKGRNKVWYWPHYSSSVKLSKNFGLVAYTKYILWHESGSLTVLVLTPLVASSFNFIWWVKFISFLQSTKDQDLWRDNKAYTVWLGSWRSWWSKEPFAGLQMYWVCGASTHIIINQTELDVATFDSFRYKEAIL